MRPIGAVLALVVAFSATGCTGEPAAPGGEATESSARAELNELALHPDHYEVGRRLEVRGYLIHPPRSVTFVCDVISESLPPQATGSCIEVRDIDVATLPNALDIGRTTWIEDEIDLTCVVAERLPGEPPERVALKCDPAPS